MRAGRVLVADTRGDELLVFGTDPLIMRQRYPVPAAPYGLAGSAQLAWVSQTAANTVIGYDLHPAYRWKRCVIEQCSNRTPWPRRQDRHPLCGVRLEEPVCR